MKIQLRTIAFSTVCLLSAGCLAHAQTSPAAPSAAAPARYLKVSAPYAQQLLVATKAAHPEIKKIGLHTVPPGETESCIIANPIESKIGKVSSPNDLTVVTSGQPKVYPHAEEGGFFDLGLPMVDAQGKQFGLMVLELPYQFAPTRDDALRMGLKIRDEVAAKIPSKAALFGPAESAQK